MEKVKVNAKKLAKMIMEHADAQLSGCCIGVNDNGDLYFYNETEASTGWIGDDVVIFTFRSVDMEMGDLNDPVAVENMADWLINDYEYESDHEFDNFTVELINSDE